MRERQKCGNCGTRHEEWDETKGGDRKAYIAVLDRCPGCEQVEYEQERYQNNKNLGKGVRVVLRRPDRP